MTSLKYNNYMNEYLKTDLNFSEDDLLSEDCFEDDLFFEELLNYLEMCEYERKNSYKIREQYH